MSGWCDVEDGEVGWVEGAVENGGGGGSVCMKWVVYGLICVVSVSCLLKERVGRWLTPSLDSAIGEAQRCGLGGEDPSFTRRGTLNS